jgi:hypothetical protein
VTATTRAQDNLERAECKSRKTRARYQGFGKTPPMVFFESRFFRGDSLLNELGE